MNRSGAVAHKRIQADITIRRRGIDPDESRRKIYLDNKFGKNTYELVVKMREDQKNLCKICERPEEEHYRGMIKHLKVDHCHKTNKIRGLICSRCNLSLGHFQDSIDLLSSAISYLRKYNV